MRITIYLAATVLTAAIIVAWGVSACANFYYGASLGQDAPFTMLGISVTTSAIFSWASLSADVGKALALFMVFAAIASRAWLPAAIMSCFFALCTVWSYSSAVGFVALNHGSVTDSRGKTAAEWEQLNNQIARIEERRRNVVAARPEGVVQADINRLLLTPGAGDCTVINGPVTQAVCPRVADLNKELSIAKSAAWLDGRLDELRGELKNQDKVTSADPFADMIAGVLGVTAKQATTGRAAFFATLLEFISAFGLWAVWTITLKRSDKPQEPLKAVPGVEIAEKSSSPAPDATGGPESTVKAHLVVDNTPKALKPPYRPEDFDRYVKLWIDQRCKPVPVTLGSQARDLHSDYRAFCRRQGVRPVNDKHFGRAIKRLKVATDRGNKGRAVYALKLSEVALARARAA